MATALRPAGSTRRAALYVRVSTTDRGQTVDNQLQPLQEAAGRLGWTVVAIYRDEGISGAHGRARRPGLDALLKGVARREFEHYLAAQPGLSSSVRTVLRSRTAVTQIVDALEQAWHQTRKSLSARVLGGCGASEI